MARSARRPAFFSRRQALTLTELLIAVAIIGILAAIATPNFLEAADRARVASAQANLRVLEGALSAYIVDYNAPPTTRPLPNDPAGIFADQQLGALLAPTAYLASADAFRDPFGDAEEQTFLSASSAPRVAPRHDEFPLPTPEPLNANRSLLYFHYPSFAAQTGATALNVPGAALISLGPDRKDSFGVFAPFPADAMPPLAAAAGYASPADTLYNPANGTRSAGDIVRLSGAVSSRLPLNW
jgi:prepilin-type N-terminal cleavage/methylation domain-containing protein